MNTVMPRNRSPFAPGGRALFTLLLATALTTVAGCDDGSAPEEDSICSGPHCDRATLDALGMDPFYQKYLDADGIPVISSEKVDDQALEIAADIVEEMLGFRSDVRHAMITGGAYVGIMATDEVTTDIPEHAFLKADTATDWDQRARGLGGTVAVPITTVGEENLLCLPEDRYRGENILVHEFAHAIDGIGISFVDPTFPDTLGDMYRRALDQGLWADTYAGSNAGEYWAEGVQSWFDTNQVAQPGIHNGVRTRAALQGYDPDLSALIEQYFGDGAWRPSCPT